MCAQEEVFWKQKSRIHWLHEGDANTKFFHAMAMAHGVVARVDSIVDELGVEHNGMNAIHSAVVNYFSSPSHLGISCD